MARTRDHRCKDRGPLIPWLPLEPLMKHIRKLAARMAARRSILSPEDLIQDALIRIIFASKRFDPKKASWRTFALQQARWAMADALRVQSEIPRTELARLNELGKKAPQVLSIDRESITIRNLHGGLPEIDLGPTPEAIACRNDFWNHLRRLLGAQLGGLMDHYYRGELTLAQIAERVGLSESRVCQMHAKAIQRLRKLIQNELGKGA